MYLTIALVVGILGHLSNGVPLESPSSDFSQFFDQRIVGGIQADEGVNPSMVALVVGYTWQSFVCGGCILTSRHILTAAHCITGFILWEGDLVDTFHAVIGSNTWHKGTVVEFEDYRIYQHYDPWDIKGDAGVLLTKGKMQMNDRVATIGLAPFPVWGGEECFVTGWGTEFLWGNTPDKLKKLRLSTLPHEKCVEGMNEAVAAQPGGYAPPIDKQYEICTFHSISNGMCHGDSGSPLVCGGKVVGIVSWGFPCARGAPDMYARTDLSSKLQGFILGCLDDFNSKPRKNITPNASIDGKL